MDQKVINRIMDRGITISKECQDTCRDFRIMTSPMRKDTLILRWTTINIDNPDHPIQCYRYECFESDGTPQFCSVNYANQQEANAFFWSLKTHYKQGFCNSHKC